MKTIKLYTGNGVSLSPINEEGRSESEFVRLAADDGKGITDGVIVTFCIDTKTPEKWSDCEAPIDEEAEISDYENSLEDLGVRFGD